MLNIFRLTYCAYDEKDTLQCKTDWVGFHDMRVNNSQSEYRSLPG